MKHIPNLITLTRIVGTIFLLTTEPFSVQFLILYFLCGVSDILDGMIARKMNSTSKHGQTLDSLADAFMIGVSLFIVVPYFTLPLWCTYWIIFIAIIRLLSLGVGFIRYKQLAFLHTYSNKLTGGTLFCFPLIYIGLGLYPTTIFICLIATISAIEELLINAISKQLCRDITSIFSI